ncbi:MAG: DUF2175 domain-containing protein [Gammaproteobacteria bacterium]|nr:DUF2175 domain-containing protein [Gammaproteobacteria bacterium]
MKCEICQQSVYGKDGITVIGIGAAHIQCFEREKAMYRVFAGILISELDDHAFNDLYEKVITEKNARSLDSTQREVELF